MLCYICGLCLSVCLPACLSVYTRPKASSGRLSRRHQPRPPFFSFFFFFFFFSFSLPQRL
ncbi:hypothetical protein F4780DRAFT_747961, partial [Xylariomycetidae sp. FL0641]